MKLKRTCENCNIAFVDYPSNRKRFCSLKCCKTFMRGVRGGNYKGGQVEWTCLICRVVFFDPHLKYVRKYCSLNCYGKSKVGRQNNPPDFYKRLGASQRGANNPNWKGGQEHRRAVNKEWQRRNMQSILYRGALRRARKRNAPGRFTLQEWERLKALFDYRCLRCLRREPQVRLTVDHVVPLIAGGSNYISNLQPLCKPCNSSKREKTIDYRKWAAAELSINIPDPNEVQP